MSKGKCGCEKESETIRDVIEILEREIANYSSEFEPERITRIRQYIKKLNTKCGP
jgi:hypothetical protein